MFRVSIRNFMSLNPIVHLASSPEQSLDSQVLTVIQQIHVALYAAWLLARVWSSRPGKRSLAYPWMRLGVEPLRNHGRSPYRASLSQTFVSLMASNTT